MEHSQDEILHVEAQLRQAMLTSDVQALNLLLHDDLLFTSHLGMLLRKQDDLDAHASGVVKMTEIELIEPIVRFAGETAIVAVKVRLKGFSQDTPFSGEFRYTRVWSFQQERWQILVGHCSEIVQAHE
jgi:ketosteroid isomerase-like protein